jgi:hypothetical protein
MTSMPGTATGPCAPGLAAEQFATDRWLSSTAGARL